MMNYDAGCYASLDRIFGGVLVGAIKKDHPKYTEIMDATKVNQARFIDYFPSNIFQDEYAIFYEAMITLSAKVFDLDQLNTLLDNNKDLILDSPFVNIDRYSTTQNDTSATDDEKLTAMKMATKDKMIELSNMYVTCDEFMTACTVFIDWYKTNYLLQTAHSMARILSDQGYDEKKPNKRYKRYSGFADCKAYYNEKIQILNELDATDKLRSYVIDGNWYSKDIQQEGRDDSEALMTIGIKEIDETLGELRRGNMLGILGPPKGGKTRFTNYIVSQALSKGLNVCVWSLEGTSSEWIATQVAAMIYRDTGVAFNSKDILQRRYKNNEERELVVATKQKLAVNPKIGRLSFIESAAYVEDFLDILEAHYEKDNPFDVIVIDQLIDVLSRTGLPKTERISRAYQELKIFISKQMKKPALAVIPAQLKQAVVDQLRRNPEDTIDVTAGGESAETIRTPDEVIGLFSSKEERAANTMRIYSVASRHSGNFPDFLVRTELKCCHFQSDPDLNN